jgi:hypothetical protein
MQANAETRQLGDALNEDSEVPAYMPTIVDAPEYGWHNEEIFDESDLRFWPGLDALPEEYLASIQRRGFDSETQAERHEWEDRRIAEFQRLMDEVGDEFPDAPDAW